MHAGIAQATQFLDQQFLDLVGGLQWTRLMVGEVEDALDSCHHFGMLTELLQELHFGLADLDRTDVFLLHPHCN
jgi:hypothetical protein